MGRANRIESSDAVRGLRHLRGTIRIEVRGKRIEPLRNRNVDAQLGIENPVYPVHRRSILGGKQFAIWEGEAPAEPILGG